MTEDFDDHDDSPPRARPSDPETSHAAVPSEERVAKEARRYLKILVESHRPLAPFEVTRIAGHDMWRRSIDLKRKKLSMEAGYKILNPQTKKMCMAHQPTAYGRLIASTWS